MLPVLWNDLFPRRDGFFPRVFGEGDPLGWVWGRVPLAMWEDKDNIYIEADLPGVNEKDVDITVHERILVIRGERQRSDDRRGLSGGWFHGRFAQAVTLPVAVLADKAKARLAHGVLVVTLPKSPEAKPKKVPLTTRAWKGLTTRAKRGAAKLVAALLTMALVLFAAGVAL
jgi:HSP20 family protein